MTSGSSQWWTLPRWCSDCEQLSMNAAAITARQQSTESDLRMSKMNWGFWITFTQNLSGRLRRTHIHRHRHIQWRQTNFFFGGGQNIWGQKDRTRCGGAKRPEVWEIAPSPVWGSPNSAGLRLRWPAGALKKWRPSLNFEIPKNNFHLYTTETCRPTE